MYRNINLEVQQRETILTEVTLEIGAMSCGIRGYQSSAGSCCSFLGGSITFLLKDSDHVTNCRTQCHSLNMYSRVNLKSYAVIYFVILIKACGTANGAEGRRIRCFCSCRMERGLTHLFIFAAKF